VRPRSRFNGRNSYSWSNIGTAEELPVLHESRKSLIGRMCTGTRLVRALLCPFILVLSVLVCVTTIIIIPLKAIGDMIPGFADSPCSSCLENTQNCPSTSLQKIYRRWYYYDPFFNEPGETRPLSGGYHTSKKNDDLAEKEVSVDLFDDL